MSENITRILVALVGAPLIFGALYMGNIFFLIILGIIALVSQKEYYSLAFAKGLHPNRTVGQIFAVVILFSFYFHLESDLINVLIFATIVSVFSEIYAKHDSPMLNSSLTLFSLIYPVTLIGTLYPLREIDTTIHDVGFNLVLAIFFGVWLSDTAAYFFGKAYGKHKLIERISPKKTWEGAIAGFSASLISMFLMKQIGFLDSSYSIIDIFLFSIFTGIGGQFGDLFESMIKRDAGVKDSGSLLPGHGGMLDRFDGILFAAPLTYIYMLLR